MKKYSFLIVSVILLLLFGKLFLNYQERYGTDGETVVLENCTTDSVTLNNIIVSKNYLPSEEDAAFAVKHLRSTFQNGEVLSSLYDLNKRAWKIPSELIEKEGSEYYRNQLAYERLSMGIDEDYLTQNNKVLPSHTTIDENCSGGISVQINSIADDAGTISKLLGTNKTPSQGILVRLCEHYIADDNSLCSRVLAYAKTDASGKAFFTGLDRSLSYSVIPIKEGCEYGSSQGTVNGNLENSGEDGIMECNFVENQHTIKVFSSATLKNIKADHKIIVRSIEDYLVSMAIYMAVFFAVWFVYLLLYKRRNPGAETGIMSLIMMLTGLCLLMMFSMNDPLNDKIIGIDMAQGVIAGVIVMMLLQFVNFTKFYQGRSRLPFDIPAEIFKLICWPFGLRKKASAMFERLPKGFGYMAAALILTMLLFTPLGVAVGGMKVNLNIGILFQPSEIAKYLIVIFIAAFFCTNADTIVKFSNKGNVDLFGSKMKMLGGILLGLIFLMGLYLLLGDMGPAMVLSFTFIIMYSIIKSKVDLEGLTEKQQLKHILTCDLAMLIYGVISFVLMLYIGSAVGLMWLFCLAWFALWILLGIFKKRVFESAIVFNMIIAAFIFGASIMNLFPGLDSVADRLESRNEMCTNTWGVLPLDGQTADPGENTQVAEGLWGLASGGFMGQGIGEGSPSSIPAFHTDMILSSIGEQTGFIGLMLVVILIILLLRNTVLQGYRAAHTFAFYLCLGIAVVTGVQFIIIALGSTGIIPLTGVTVPFFSFGKVSMILNLAAFGIVLSIAGRNAHEPDASEEIVRMRKDQMKKYDYSIALTSLAFTAVSLFILGVYLKYQVFQRDEILIRPVYVNNSEGYPVVNYNPRIEQVAERMPIGNIYDRNGILLATSDVDLLLEHKDDYIRQGVAQEYLDDHLRQRLRRYYPFGEHLFFMLGDYNTRLFFTSGDQRGYLAEARHLSRLRGYDDRMYDGVEYIKVDLQSESFKPGKFFGNDSTLVINGFQLRDYSALLPALKSGDSVGTQPEDVTLTIDAGLQVQIQNSLAEFVQDETNTYRWTDPFTGKRSDVAFKDNSQLRISVVVMDARTGDLLTSALYPLPDQERLMSMSDSELITYKDIDRGEDWNSYTDMDLGLLYPTQPGSTAKVMSSMAALISDDLNLSEIRNLKYFNSREEKVGYEYEVNLNKGLITMHDALTKSSNNYFIKLVNDKMLYDELADVYTLVGARLMYEQPYVLFHDMNYDNELSSVMTEHSKYAVSTFNKYMERIGGDDPKTCVGPREKLSKHAAWQLAWGQGELTVSPLTMARVASIVASDGNMPVTRYSSEDPHNSVVLEGMDINDVRYLRECMGDEAEGHKFDARAYGKTGTAQRTIGYDAENKEYYKEQDGWYMGYCDGRSGPIAFALRIERGPGSGIAADLTKEVLIPALKQMNYIK